MTELTSALGIAPPQPGLFGLPQGPRIGGSSTPSIPKAMAYDASKNGSIGDIITTVATRNTDWDRYATDYFAGIFAITAYDGTNWTVRVATVASNVLTVGSPVTISDVNSTSIAVFVCVVSASLVAIGYKDNSGTPVFRIRTYSIAGTTLSADQNLSVANHWAGSSGQGALVRQNGGRLICAYVNTTPRLQVIGINASVGVLTKDGASTEVVAVNWTLGTNPLGICANGLTTSLIVFDVNGTDLKDAIITDGGTSLSLGSVNTALLSNGGAPAIALSTITSALAASASGNGSLAFYIMGGGAISNASRSGAINPAAGGMMAGLAASNGTGVGGILGDVDSSGYDWYVFPSRRDTGVASEAWVCFVGIKQGGSQAESASVEIIRRITTSATNYGKVEGRVVAISNTQFLFSYIDPSAGASKYKYLVCNL